jgi:hypothetical protein
MGLALKEGRQWSACWNFYKKNKCSWQSTFSLNIDHCGSSGLEGNVTASEVCFSA